MGSASVHVRYVPNRGFARKVMKSDQVSALVGQEADEVCARASSMFDASSYGVSGPRNEKVSAHAYVHTGDRHAMRSNRLHNTLQKALG